MRLIPRLLTRRPEPASDEASAWSTARPLIAPHRRGLAVLGASAFLRGVFEAAFLVVVTRTALAIADGQDRVGVLAGRSASVEVALAFGVLLVVLRLVVALSANAIASRINATVTASLRMRLASAYLNSSWRTQSAEPSGRLQELLSSFAAAGAGAVSAITASMIAALSLIALLLGALAVDFVATLAVMVVLVVLASVLTPLRHRVRLRARTLRTAQIEFTTAVAELGSLGLEMQTFGVRDQFGARISSLVDELARAHRRTELLRGALVPVYTTMAYIALIGGLASAAIADVGKLSSLGAVMLIMLRSLAYGQQLQLASANLMTSIPSLERIDETVARYEADRASGGSTTLPSVDAIEFRDVSFSYLDGQPTLVDVSFTMQTGETIGIIGPSGAGKSTLVHLLLGLRDPSEGSVLVSGVDLRDVERSWWSSQVAFVAQDPLLFTGDVAENIRFFRDGISMEEIRDAARRANVLAEIESMPDGFETHLGPRAGRLSGGQRQRISIARALVGRPRLLVLDEPTSSLDIRSEALIRQTIADLGGEVTVAIIAHRMSTLDICDRLMVVDGGRVVALQEPVELRESSEFFRKALELSGLE